MCADKREHVVVSQEAKRDLPGALANYCRQHPVEDLEGSPLWLIAELQRKRHN